MSDSSSHRLGSLRCILSATYLAFDTDESASTLNRRVTLSGFEHCQLYSCIEWLFSSRSYFQLIYNGLIS